MSIDFHHPTLCGCILERCRGPSPGVRGGPERCSGPLSPEKHCAFELQEIKYIIYHRIAIQFISEQEYRWSSYAIKNLSLLFFLPLHFSIFMHCTYTVQYSVQWRIFLLIIRAFDLRYCDLRLTLGRATLCSLIIV
jgi:hypothetical protein